jgi:hypothetical protein
VAIELRGITEPGTVVKVNGRPCQVGDDGNFALRPGPGRDGVIRIETEHSGKSKVVIRRFRNPD